MNALEPWHLLIIAGVVVLLFGAKRLPDSARSLGRSMRIFRSEMHEAKIETKIEAKHEPDDAILPAAPVAAVPHATEVR